MRALMVEERSDEASNLMEQSLLKNTLEKPL
jgi:hypothetical protein